MEEPPRRQSTLIDQSVEELYTDMEAWSKAATIAKLIIGDTAVLDSLRALNSAVRVIGNAMSSGYDEHNKPADEWHAELTEQTDTVDSRALELSDITRQRFWSTKG